MEPSSTASPAGVGVHPHGNRDTVTDPETSDLPKPLGLLTVARDVGPGAIGHAALPIALIAGAIGELHGPIPVLQVVEPQPVINVATRIGLHAPAGARIL